MKKIVLVDDSCTARVFTQRSIEIAGLKNVSFLHASNGKEVLDILEKETVDMIIMGLNMPIMDGETLLKHIKQANIDIPIIVITSCSNSKRDSELIDIGAYTVLQKPANPSSLKPIIQELLVSKVGSRKVYDKKSVQSIS